MSLVDNALVLADPLFSVCSWPSVRERFYENVRHYSPGKKPSSEIDPFIPRHCLENTYSFGDPYTVDVWDKTVGSNAKE